MKAIAEEGKHLESLRKALAVQTEAARSNLEKAMSLRRAGAISEVELQRTRQERDTIEQKLMVAHVDEAKLEVSHLQAILDAEKERFQLEESMDQLRSKLLQLDRDESDHRIRRREQLFDKREQLLVAENKAKLADKRLQEAAEVRPALSGRVIEIQADQGTMVTAGAPIVAIELPDHPLVVVCYTKAFEGKKIQPGMIVEVTPSTVKREEYGFILGIVDAVSDFPASEEAMLNLIPNKVLVNELRKDGASIEVHIKLQVAATPSGYHWSSGQGPALVPQSGTLSTCRVRIREQAPITLVLPTLRRVFGLD
jgi:HlyD family secretion protein